METGFAHRRSQTTVIQCRNVCGKYHEYKYIEQLDERTSEIRELEDKWNKLLARVKHLEVRELELLQIISSLEKRVKELEEENLQLMRGTT